MIMRGEWTEAASPSSPLRHEPDRYRAVLDADAPSAGFRTIDCDTVVGIGGLLASDHGCWTM